MNDVDQARIRAAINSAHAESPDPWTATAAAILGIRPEDITKQQRVLTRTAIHRLMQELGAA